MSLEALAPDQRAVVQLVLQQERSYDDLAGLLGISTDAVRERARAGLERVGGSPGDLTAEELGEIADYLLGQQSVSRREATRSLLSTSADARRWASRVSAALADVARSPLPGVPDAGEGDDVSPTTAAPAPEPTTAPALSLPEEDEEPEEEADAPEARETRAGTQVRDGDGDTAPVRARPRPRPTGDAPRPRPASGTGSGAPRSSKIGGALLIAGIAVMLAVVVIFVVGRDDEDGPERTTGSTATPTATATPETPAAGGQIELRAPGGGEARGTMTILVTQEGEVQFSIEGTNVAPSREGEAYAVWLTGGGEPKRLGFAPTVGDDGKLGVSGPREGDEETFPRDFSRARRIVVSRETSQDATKPGPVILQGTIPRGAGGG